MDVKLVIEQGKTRTKALHLRKDEGLVGRVKGCDFRIPSLEVSRRHCLLRVRDGYLTVEDLKSSNGTHLNGEEVEGEQVVRPGDRLRIGPVTFIVEYQLTPEAIDRLLRGEDVHADGAEPEFEILDEVAAEPTADEDVALEPVEEEPAPELDDLEVINAAEFQLPETDELRDILTSLDEDEAPPDKKGKKKR
ncbi:MAG TPA: FHA domain-containing protein [Gemmataceae bacterium]|nr:FHA domain-containing protein [Gemmataceae bacterium]